MVVQPSEVLNVLMEGDPRSGLNRDLVLFEGESTNAMHVAGSSDEKINTTAVMCSAGGPVSWSQPDPSVWF